ncbi:MAG: nucleotidyltransferase domain-containing protein [Clostridia bacterium]|nr:nucleotidyltransferase domain-containing protein [Clostridia bacterium]
MKYGLPQNTYQEIKKVVQKYSNYEFQIYGSRARGNYKENSDIDIAVRGNITEKDRIAILNDFDLLNIPYMVDIVFYGQLEKQELKESIDKEGILYE